MESNGSLSAILKDGYNSVFNLNWPFWLGGLLIGVISVFTFAWARPWGVAGGLREMGDAFFGLVGFSPSPNLQIWRSSSWVMDLGLLLGAFCSALLSKQFSIRMSPGLELIKGAIGGVLMGIGAVFAGGCNVGGFYSAVSSMSLSGIAMMVGLFIGAYGGLKYLYWELEHLPSSTSTGSHASSVTPDTPLKSRLQLEPYWGVAVLFATGGIAYYYAKEAYSQLGGLLLCGFAFGVTIQRTRFCFVRCFRDPFMTGDGSATKAVALSLIVSIIGFTILKWTGLRSEEAFIPATFGWGALMGGVIFGFGMSLAGGCGSGSLWRAGEGQVKLWLTVITFSLSSSLTKQGIHSFSLASGFLGRGIFLPRYLTYKWSLFVFILFFLCFYLLAAWNERNDVFTVQI